MSTDTHFTSSLLKQSQLTASSHRLFWSQTVYRHTSVPSNPALGVYVTLSPPSIEHCPFDPSVMLTIVRGLPLGNRSFVSGCNVTGVSSFVDTVSSTASCREAEVESEAKGESWSYYWILGMYNSICFHTYWSFIWLRCHCDSNSCFITVIVRVANLVGK